MTKQTPQPAWLAQVPQYSSSDAAAAIQAAEAAADDPLEVITNRRAVGAALAAIAAEQDSADQPAE